MTVEHLLTHTSGIGDYCDEEADPPPTPLLAERIADRHGDGGIYSTAPDFRAFWPAFLGGRIVPREWVDRMPRPHADRYGLGFWLPWPGRSGSKAVTTAARSGARTPMVSPRR
ncbi:hypothetical protein ACGFMK_08355 [Amycolatopsis sp. NPDC049252]|uniref:hypothetical protein n=1 Tax=Amycolatopsis sp. NPDC049252 TaxID=3363933 RepID=UPI0037102560